MLCAVPMIPLGHEGIAAQPAGEECSITEMGNATFGAPVEVDVVLSAATANVRRLLPEESEDRAAIRFLVSVDAVEGADWTLEFRDEGLRLLDRIDADDLAEGSSTWTGRFSARQASAHLIGASAEDRVRIEKAIVYRDDGSGELFSILDGEPRWQSLHGDDEEAGVTNLTLARTGDSVGMMVASGLNPQFQTESWCCSGVMLTPSLYLTNWHCGGNKGFSEIRYWDPNVNASVLIDLAWDGGARNRQYRSEEVVYTNRELDIALLRVVPTRGGTGDDIGAIGVPIGSDPVQGQQAVTVHHPLCQPKKATIRECRIDAVKVPGWNLPDGSALGDSDFYHTCDTDTGSSGAPIFDASGKLIGLHHLGFGQPQLCEANPPRRNRAVRIEAILADLEANAPTVHSELTAR